MSQVLAMAVDPVGESDLPCVRAKGVATQQFVRAELTPSYSLPRGHACCAPNTGDHQS